MPDWLEALAVTYLVVAGASAATVVFDLLRGHAQNMWIMNFVWPITVIWSGPVGLWFYFRYGRAASKQSVRAAKQRGEDPPNTLQPFPVLTAKGTTHCGSGCTLGDVIAEWLVVLVPLTLFGWTIFGAWIYDYIFAFSLGIAFQYFTIKPMRQLSRRAGLRAALKADALSLTAWQVGMYGWMGIATFAIFGHEIEKTSPVFWFMMQLAMFLGFMTSYPVNWWLIRRGIKERM